MARSKANGRTAATNRVAVQDIKSSLRFDGTSSKVALTQTSGLPLYANTAFSVCMWVNHASFGNMAYFAEGRSSDISPLYLFGTNANGLVRLAVRNNSAVYQVNSSATASNKPMRTNMWYHVALVDNNGDVHIYINGVEDANTANNTMDYTRSTLTLNQSTLGCLSRVTDGDFFKGSMSGAKTFSRALSATEVMDIYKSGMTPSGATAVYPLQEGAGNIAYDSSGNGNNGTITAGTYTDDVPTKKRGVVGGNLVKNGDFEYAPPFVAATNTQYREIDGTAGGRALPSGMMFGWSLSSLTGGGSAMYDNGAMKVSTTATGSSAYVRIAGNTYFRQNLIKCLPNTSYTASVRIKTNYVSGDSTAGARLDIKGLSSTYSDIATYVVNSYIKTTTDWTQYTTTFTTGSSTIYLDTMMAVNGSSGTGTLIMDAWFSNIELRPTSNIVRNVVT